MANQHLIHRQLWEVDLSSSLDAMHLQFDLEQLAKTKLHDIIDEVLSALVPDDVYLQIPSLELDIGHIQPDLIEEEILETFRTTLEEEVKKTLSVARLGKDLEGIKMSSVAQSKAENFIHYLQHGVLAKWPGDEGEKTAEHLFDVLMKDSPQQLQTQLIQVLHKPTVAQRLIFQFNAPQLSKLAALMAPSLAVPVQMVLRQPAHETTSFWTTTFAYILALEYGDSVPPYLDFMQEKGWGISKIKPVSGQEKSLFQAFQQSDVYRTEMANKTKSEHPKEDAENATEKNKNLAPETEAHLTVRAYIQVKNYFENTSKVFRAEEEVLIELSIKHLIEVKSIAFKKFVQHATQTSEFREKLVQRISVYYLEKLLLLLVENLEEKTLSVLSESFETMYAPLAVRQKVWMNLMEIAGDNHTEDKVAALKKQIANPTEVESYSIAEADNPEAARPEEVETQKNTAPQKQKHSAAFEQLTQFLLRGFLPERHDAPHFQTPDAHFQHVWNHEKDSLMAWLLSHVPSEPLLRSLSWHFPTETVLQIAQELLQFTWKNDPLVLENIQSKIAQSKGSLLGTLHANKMAEFHFKLLWLSSNKQKSAETFALEFDALLLEVHQNISDENSNQNITPVRILEVIRQFLIYENWPAQVSDPKQRHLEFWITQLFAVPEAPMILHNLKEILTHEPTRARLIKHLPEVLIKQIISNLLKESTAEILVLEKELLHLSAAEKSHLFALFSIENIRTSQLQFAVENPRKPAASDWLIHFIKHVAIQQSTTLSKVFAALKTAILSHLPKENKLLSTLESLPYSLVAALQPQRAKRIDDLEAIRQEIDKMTDISEGEGYWIDNAGLVLFGPYYKRFFEYNEWIVDNEFPDVNATFQAVQALQYLVTGEVEFSEPDMLLNKLICGLDIAMPLPKENLLTEKHLASCDDLLVAVIGNWEVMKNTSPDGLRSAFLKRKARLVFEGASWQLQVEELTLDILLQQLPWSYGIMKLPWMPQMITTEW